MSGAVGVDVLHGDCLTVMADMPAESVDAIVTDPPYGLGFMGKAWDGLPPGREWAEACLRVLKPGGHLLAFGGSRTWHRMAVAVEDGGFEIRDSIAWLYGSGFPKSLDVSKAIDKQRTEDLEPAAAVARWLVDRMAERGITRRDISEHFGAANVAQQWTTHWTDGAVKPRVPRWEQWLELRDWLNLPGDMDAEVWRLNGNKGKPGEAWDARVITGVHHQGNAIGNYELKHGVGKGRTANERRDAPATPDAERWQGWGTALKPAFEPIVVARKPLAGTVAGNVLAYGTGALNIDACRIGAATPDGSGRWPANVVLDEHTAPLLDQQSGVAPPSARTAKRDYGRAEGGMLSGGLRMGAGHELGYTDSGGASRFFYVAKASKRERPVVNGTSHPTVKPLTLMRWLVRLITPPGGTVLDTFAGSGTTLEAAMLEGFHAIGIEAEADYLPLIRARLARHDGTLDWTTP